MLTTIIIFENALHRRDGKILAANDYSLPSRLDIADSMFDELYFVIPFLSNRSLYATLNIEWKFDSVGITWLISAFKDGHLLDFGFGYKTITILSSLGWCTGVFHVMLRVISCARSKDV